MPEDSQSPVKARVVIVDPVNLRVVWGNEAAGHDLPAPHDVIGMPVDDVLGVLGEGLTDAITRAAASGEPQRLSRDVVSTVRGSMTMATSVYRLPDGQVLIVSENDWRPRHERPESTRRGGRRGR